MAHPRLDESTINASLDAYLHGAEKGDVNQARKLHEMLDRILSGREERDGKLWLTILLIALASLILGMGVPVGLHIGAFQRGDPAG